MTRKTAEAEANVTRAMDRIIDRVLDSRWEKTPKECGFCGTDVALRSEAVFSPDGRAVSHEGCLADHLNPEHTRPRLDL